MNKTRALILLGAVFVLGIIFWAYREATKPLPGQVVEELGRDHITDIFGIKYNSNPPTSGPHFAVWAKSGVYDRLISDGYLIHSLEHGYIIISYDCTKSVSSYQFSVTNVYAHDEPATESTDSGQLLMHLNFQPKDGESWFTPENPPEIEVELPETFKSEACQNLANELAAFTKIAQRVIVVPRVGLENKITLTAWGRIEKLDTVDKEKITVFIKTFHNRGPETTME